MKHKLNESETLCCKAQRPAVIAALIFSTLLSAAALMAQTAPDTADAADAPPQLEEPATNTVSSEAEAATNGSTHSDHDRKGVSHEAIVVFGKNVELKPGDTAEAVVVINGSAKIRGKVRDAAVVIGGDLTIDGGEVADAAVAVMGNLRATNNAKIRGEATSVGGRIDVSDDSTIEGGMHQVDFAGAGLHIEWLKKWFLQCVLKLRPLAPQVGWVWGVAGVFFLIYLLIIALFPQPVLACVSELSRRPATSFVTGLLTKLLAPIVILILLITGIGAIVVPFVLAAMVLGYMVGKVAIGTWIGLRLGSRFAGGQFQKPVAGFVLGSIVILILYMIPVLGLITFGVITVWGLGCAVSAALGGLRKELPAKPVAAIQPKPVAPGPVPPELGSVPTFSQPNPSGATAVAFANEPATATGGAATAVAELPQESKPIMPTPLPEVLTYPKAGIWPRLGAGFLDIVLAGIGFGLVGGPPQGFLVVLAYFTAMWTWKGTTVGGVIVGLKVVRLDGQPLSITVALVRCLACMFGVMVFFLGFLWIAWDEEKQGWHDKIAGTVVLRLPRGMPLV
jgi:uncharacterized RDD family membrane protein YckC